jgi:hypothetical protein
MTYGFINGERVILELIDRYNVETTDWLGRMSKWIEDGIRDLSIGVRLESTKETVVVDNYKFRLPCDIEYVEDIEYKGRKIDRTRNVKHRDEIENRHPDYAYQLFPTYSLNGSEWATLESDSEFDRNGEVIVYYKRIPVEYSNTYNILLPMVPDNHFVIKAIATFCMIKLLYRGYKHPVFTIENNNPATNPYYMYHGLGSVVVGEKQMARSKVLGIDRAEVQQISKIRRSLFSDPNLNDNSHFQGN